MRKVHLLTTVAASLLIATAAMAADNNEQKSKGEMSNPAPVAQQKAPAEKIAPPMQAGQKKPETTGQATKSDDNDKADLKASDSNKAGMKADDKKAETSGQAPKPSNAGKTEMNESKDKSGASINQKTDTKSDTKSGAASQSSPSANTKASTSGQGAASGSAKLSSEQRTKIATAIKHVNAQPAKLNIAVRVGATVPETVHFYPLPTEVVTIYPEWRGYDFILVGDEIIIINPRNHTIVAILEA